HRRNDGHARTRRNRHRRAAHDLDGRCHRQCGLQRRRRAGRHFAADSAACVGCPGERGERLMKNFTYYQPKSVESAVALLEAKWGRVELLAGGTDLLDLQKEYIAQPEKVVSLSAVKSDLFDGGQGTRFGNITREGDGQSFGIG